jgi:DHA1 family tetracycline resistance protein-like MFS transporter
MGSRRSAAIVFILITVLIDVIGLGIIIPVMPELIMELTGGGLSEASLYGGWLLFTYAVMQFLFAPVLGALSDQYGRRPVLLIALFGFFLDYLLLGWAPTIWWLFLGRFLSGITGASFTTANAYIADISEPEKRAQNFGMIGAAFGIGFIIGPVFGGLLGSFGPRVPFFAAAGLSFLNWLYGYFILPESLPKENRRPFHWKRANPVGALLHLKIYPIVLSLAGVFFFIFLSQHATQSTWTYFTMEKFDWDEQAVGYSLGFVGLLIAIVQGGLTRKIIPRIGPSKSLFIGIVMNVIGFILFVVSTKGWMMYLFMIPFALGGLAGPSLQGIITNQVPSNAQGELQGALSSVRSLTAIIGPPFMTFLFSFFTRDTAPFYLPGAPFLAGAVCLLVSLVWAYFVLRKLN